MAGEQPLIVTLPDSSNEAQTENASTEHVGGKKKTERETEIVGLRIDKTICRSARAWFVCVCVCV